jgi:diguanylate cyclase (GGDEF)-like protein
MTKRKFTWLLVSLILIGFIITGLVSYQIAHETLEEQTKRDSLPLTSDNIYSEIQQDLIRPIFISSLMAQDTFVRDWTLSGEKGSDKIIQYLNEIRQQYGTVTSFFVSDLTKNYYHYSGVLKTIDQNDASDAWYFRVKSQDPGKDYEINIDHDTANSDQIVVFVNYRVYDFQHNFIGVIGVGLSSNAVADLIEKYKIRYDREIYFINDIGQVTLQGSQPLGFSSIQQSAGLRDLATQILTSPSMSGSYHNADGQQIYVSSRWVEEFQWHIMVQQNDRFDNRFFLKALINNFSISLVVAILVVFIAHFSFRGYQSRLERMATIDKLTGAFNRHAFDELIESAINRSEQKQVPFSIALLDIDHFKTINDSYGHQMGDQVLQQVAQACQSQLSEQDVVCRWGGEEFVILLPGTDLNQAQLAMERLKQTINEKAMKPSVTVSIGVVQRIDLETKQSVIHRADTAMYRAKESGRNRVFTG